MSLAEKIGPASQRGEAGVRSPSPQNIKIDPLTDALIYLAAHHGRAISRQALLTGLPITDGRLTAGLFERAAKQAGLEVQAIKRPIAEIASLVLPAVLVMRDGSTRILLENHGHPREAKVIDPSATARVARPLGDDFSNYLGYAFLARPVTAASARVAAAGPLPRAHWFWSVVKAFWTNYSHVAIAAFIINTLALAYPLFIMNVYDRVVPNGAIPSLVALSIGLAIAVAFDFLLRTVRSHIIDMTGKTIDVALSAKIFEHVLSIKMAQRPTSVGILANQLRDF
ncbi:MAG TPA: ABC transporter transmembrane domain-containing protein, partial [Pirellulales bacterium]|nr:ABC transporter transmembrane domain-containing protein [Pirellulales bacterium]